MGQMAHFKDLLRLPTDAVGEENNSKKELFCSNIDAPWASSVAQ